MNRSLRIGLMVIGLGVLMSVISISDAKAQGPLGTILNRLDAHNKALTSLRADVTMVKHNPQLNVSDTYKGTTSYLPKTPKRGAYMRLDWAKPRVEQISLIGDNYELYRPSINTVYYGKVEKTKQSSSAGNALAFMNMSKGQLNANFEVVYIGEEQISGGVNTWHLQLTPKTASSYKSAELWVDSDGMPRQGKIVEQNSDTTTVLLSNIRKNEKVDAGIFKLNTGSAKRLQA